MIAASFQNLLVSSITNIQQPHTCDYEYSMIC